VVGKDVDRIEFQFAGPARFARRSEIAVTDDPSIDSIWREIIEQRPIPRVGLKQKESYPVSNTRSGTRNGKKEG
jgi:hypothetical protein